MPLVALTLLLVIRTYDAFGVSRHDLEIARQTADRALGAAGFETAWTACQTTERRDEQPSTRCELLPQSGEVVIRIVADGQGTGDRSALGDAFVDTKHRQGVLATLYGGRIAAVAEQAGVEPGWLLGRALAHEVGHLLIGSAGHGSRGLMRAHWTLEELRRRIDADWLFSGADAVAMQASLKRRLLSPSVLPLKPTSPSR